MKYELLYQGLNAPICLTWEITYGCNLHCSHCLSSSGRKAANELSLEESKHLLDEFAEMQVFYINIGGGEPFIRPDFFNIVEYSIKRGIGVKFSTNGTLIDRSAAKRIAGLDYVDVQISLEGATAEVNDQIRGSGSFERALGAMELLREYRGGFKVNAVVTRRNFHQLDALYKLAKSFGAQLRLSRFRPSGRGQQSWALLHLTKDENVALYHWLITHPDVLTGDSFFHLSPLGEKLPGLNLCGAGRVVCSITPTGDVYACPFLLAEPFYAGNVREQPFRVIWRESDAFQRLRNWHVGACKSCWAFDVCHGGCMAVKYFMGVDLNDPDPECVIGADG